MTLTLMIFYPHEWEPYQHWPLQISAELIILCATEANEAVPQPFKFLLLTVISQQAELWAGQQPGY